MLRVTSFQLWPLRDKFLNFERPANNFPKFLDRSNFTRSHCLSKCIPGRGRFCLTSNNAPASDVSGQLVQQAIARAPANDVDGIDTSSRQLLQ